MMVISESPPDVKFGARRRIFFRTESLRDGGHARFTAAFWDCASACIAGRAGASVGDWRCCRAVSYRILCRQDSILRHGLGLHSHIHTAAGSRVSCLHGRWRRRSGVAVGSGSTSRRRRAHLARDKGEYSSRGQFESRAVQQLDAKSGRRCTRGLAVVDVQRASCGYNDYCRSAAGALHVLDLPPVSICSARGPENARSLFQIKHEPVEKRLIPELRVLRLEHPMALVGKDDEL